MKYKRSYQKLHTSFHKKKPKEDEEEIYGASQTNENYEVSQMEKRINEWLDCNDVNIKDPMEKKDAYYQWRKNMVIKSTQNSPEKEFNTHDCNSPSLNLSSNSALFMKRRMKSSNTVAESAEKVKIPSKFSQN